MHQCGKLLCIDHGSRFGWTFVAADGSMRHGAESLPPAHGEDYGRLFNRWREWLRGMIAIDRPDVIWFERALVGEHSSQSAAIILIGMMAHTVEIAASKGIPWKHIGVSTIRKHFCGDGRAKKSDVGYHCRKLGIEVSDPNEADALALAHYAVAHPTARSMPLLFPGTGAAA